MKSFHQALLLTFVSQSLACIDFAGEDGVLTPLPYMVTARGTPFYGKEGIHAPGPVNQLCVDLTNSATINGGSSSASARVQVAGRKPVDLMAVLINRDSARVVLQFAGTRKTKHGQLACFEKELLRDTSRRYYRGELVSDDSVFVYGIRWASGKRVRSLRALANTR
jgi:hypothetical protein